MNKCNHCAPPIMNNDPCRCPIMPPHYPYNRPACDYYTTCCCGNGSVNPVMKDYPSSGPFVGSAFTLNDANPYLINSTNMSYGMALVYSESVYTNITKRDDLSCINLAATFDMTDTNLTNVVRMDFLKQYINRKYEELSGVLPIVKNNLKVRVKYVITDMMGGVVHSSHSDCEITQTHFHFTDINDVFVQSLQGLIIDNIPAMTFQGQYTITITTIELYVDIIDTKEHLVNGLNPFYIFTDNNTKIQLQSQVIENTEADRRLLIGTCEVNKSFDYYANVSNRLRMTFVAFTSIPIACGDTSGVWNALNEPTDAVITQLRNEVTAMEEEIRLLHEKDASQDAVIAQLQGQVALNTENIGTLMNTVNNLVSLTNDFRLQIIDLQNRLAAVEDRPYALVHYELNKGFLRSQLTWRAYGELYQATCDFTAAGNFQVDIDNGNLTPVQAGTIDLSGLIDRIETCETTSTEANATATAAKDEAELLNTTVTEQGTQISTNTTAIETNSGAISSLNTVVTALNEEVDDLDERVTALEAPIDNSKVNVICVDDNSITYYDTMSDAVTFLKSDEATGSAYDVVLGSSLADTTYAQFSGIQKLRKFNNNGCVVSIPTATFAASSLAEFTFGDMTGKSVSMSDSAFNQCRNLTSITLPTEASSISLGSVAFASTGLTTITLPVNITSMGTQVFAGCTSLTSADIYTANIYSGTFAGCSNLVDVTLNDGVTNIGARAFGTTSVAVIDIPSTMETMDAEALAGANITTINIHKAEDSISGAPWGATGATVNWNV